MSTTPPPTVQGTHAPSPIELVWERYKSLFYVVVLAIVGAVALHAGYNKYKQSQADALWTPFNATIGLEASYTDQAKAFEGLQEHLSSLDPAKLRSSITAAPDSQKPYLMLALARRCMIDKDWDGAEAALKDLETTFPNHVLVHTSAHPIQTQDPIKDKEATPNKPGQKPKKPEYKPAVQGSAVGLMRAQIAAAKTYAAPSLFAKPEIPANADKVKFELGDSGSFTLALMKDQAPKHCEAFLKLAQAETPIWVGLAIDEIHRPTKTFKQPRELHLGFETTSVDDRDKWTTTDPSKNPVDYENNNLSHFPGAVSARAEAGDKSCADRFWVAVDDASSHDGERVVFAYVVEGLEDLKKICDSSMSAQDEERGQGKPSDTIRVTKVTVIK